MWYGGVGGGRQEISLFPEVWVSVWGEKPLCVRGISETSLTYIKHTTCMCTIGCAKLGI